MKKLILLFMILLLSTSFAVNDMYSPDYSKSTVTIDTDWGTSEKITDVDVVVFTNQTPTTFVLMKKGKRKHELYLIKGTTIKIYTDNKLIETYTL